LEREHWRSGLLGSGFAQRYKLTPAALFDAVKTCALFHDLGKLQEGWQRWAEAAQRSQSSTYQHTVPLAHTDFNPEKKEDRERERSLGIRRPAHAPASTYYGRAFFVRLLTAVPEEQRAYVVSACAAAVLAHHGGWWPIDMELNPPKLWSGWETALMPMLGWIPEAKYLANLRKYTVDNLLNVTAGAENLTEWWPLVAYLTRTLRLSDQRATAERACHEGCDC
jgi:hypothetical protein